MKTHKRVISILLALVLFVSCVGAGIIAETGTTSNPTLTIQTDPPVEQSALPTPETTPISSEPTQSATTEEVQSGTTEQSSISVSESSSFTVETTQSETDEMNPETETSAPTVAMTTEKPTELEMKTSITSVLESIRQSSTEEVTTVETIPDAMEIASSTEERRTLADPYTHRVNSYFPATGTSTNDHYSVEGVFIGTDDRLFTLKPNRKELR